MSTMNAPSGWSVSLDKLTEQAQVDLETVARKATFDLFMDVVLRSPVGNPDLWKANAGQAYKRETYNLFASALGAKAKSNKMLKKQFPNVAGKGYVGGRFRANWNVSMNAPDESTSSNTDASKSIGEVSKALTLPVGGVVYLTNGLPYARELEYGHSTQAPNGMVRLAVQRFEDHVKSAIS